jgi:hypothetical protein
MHFFLFWYYSNVIPLKYNISSTHPSQSHCLHEIRLSSFPCDEGSTVDARYFIALDVQNRLFTQPLLGLLVFKKYLVINSVLKKKKLAFLSPPYLGTLALGFKIFLCYGKSGVMSLETKWLEVLCQHHQRSFPLKCAHLIFMRSQRFSEMFPDVSPFVWRFSCCFWFKNGCHYQ